MRRNQEWLKATNVLLSLVVVWVFMYLLVLAMAQDQVVAKLSRSAEFNNYSSSLVDARQGRAAAERVEVLARERQQLRAELFQLENQAAMAELLYQREAGRLRPIIATLDGTRDCRITSKPIVAVGGLTPQETEMQVNQVELAAARECFDLDDELGGPRRARYLATLANAKRFSDASVRADMARNVKTRQARALQDEINRQVAERSRFAATRVHFTVLDSLEGSWFPINLVDYPPFIIRVLLSFFSGAFGALLITMVFVVYPSKLRERVSAKLYVKRMFLGGIVALTVFIVLTGGAAILGTSEVSTDDANVMSFTAIGLLAGMFSDTVADWLSARAKKMFSTDEDDEKDKNDATEPRKS